MMRSAQWGVRPRAKSLLTSSLPHTFERCHQPQQHEPKRREREGKFWANYQETVCCDPAKTRQETVFEMQQKHTVKDVFAVPDHRLFCLSSYSLNRKVRVASKDYPVFRSASSLATPGKKKAGLLEHYCICESNLCM